MKKTIEPFLKKRLDQYDEWLGKGEIKYASKVVPIKQSIPSKQYVIPTEQGTRHLDTIRK